MSQLVAYFAIYSVLGWLIEVAYAWYKQRRFVNRGFLSGPYCPIYGFGITFMLLLLSPFQNNWLTLLIGTTLITSGLEYVTGYVLEAIFHAKWWDYSERPFHIKGYICLQFSIVWGVAGTAMILWFHPMIQRLLNRLPGEGVTVAGLGLVAVMLLDMGATAVNIFKLNERLKELTDKLESFSGAVVRERLIHEGMEVMASVEGVIQDAKEELGDKLDGAREKMARFKEKYADLMAKAVKSHGRIIRAFPNVRVERFKHILAELKKEVNK